MRIGYGYCATCGRVGTHDRDPDGSLQCVDWRECLAYRAALRAAAERRATRERLGIPELEYGAGATPTQENR